MNRKILMSVGAIAFVAALSISATGAFFSDTEKSTGNTFTAGEIDLKIDNTSYGFDWNNPDIANPKGDWIKNNFNTWEMSDLTNQLFFRFDDLKPGDYGEDTISLHVQNDAWACMDIKLTGAPENVINGPETKIGDVTDGANGGELQNYLHFAFWRDDGDNVYENNEGPLLFNGAVNELNSTTTIALADVGVGQGPLHAADPATYVGKFWCFGDITSAPVTPAANPNGPTPGNTGFTCKDLDPGDNIAQTDGIMLDVSFSAVQSRNNGNFLCRPQTAPTTGTITVNKSVSFTDATIEGVEVNDFTLHLVGPSGDVIVTDEVPSGPLLPGAYTVSEVYSNIPTGVTWDAQFTLNCTDDGQTGTVNLGAGQNLTCNLNNAVSAIPTP